MRRTADNPDGNSSAPNSETAAQSATAASRLLLDRNEAANLLGQGRRGVHRQSHGSGYHDAGEHQDGDSTIGNVSVLSQMRATIRMQCEAASCVGVSEAVSCPAQKSIGGAP